MNRADQSRITAAAWIIGGAAWVTNGLLGLDSVDGSRGFYVSEVVWLGVHALVLFGLIGLLRHTPRDDLLSRRGLALALVGRVVFLVAEIVAIVVADDEIALLPLAALLTAVGMTLVGIGILRSRRWVGWQRFAPLVMGVYPFVAMFPVVAVTGVRPDMSVSLWGLTIVAVGVAMMTRSATETVAGANDVQVMAL